MTTRRTRNSAPSADSKESSYVAAASTAANDAISHRSPFLPGLTEAAFLSIYPLTLFLGSLFSSVAPFANPPQNASTYSHAHQAFHPPSLAPSYFATKGNIFNVYFVKIGWFWSTVAVWAWTLLAARGRAQIDLGVSQLVLGEEAARSGHGSPRLDELPDDASRRVQSHARLRRQWQALVRWGLCTTLWYVVTQAFFGPPIVDRGFSLTGGYCSPRSGGPAMPEFLSARECRAAGGVWKGGWDISGHVFLLILGSGMLWFELLPLVLGSLASSMSSERVLRDTQSDHNVTASALLEPYAIRASMISGNIKPSRDSPRSKKYSTQQFEAALHAPPHTLKAYATALALVVACLSWWMLLMTAAFFHTWSEKASAFILAAAGLWVVYFAPRGLPWLRTLVGVPGV